MAETDLKIKDAPLTGSISGSMKLPISDGSNSPKTASITQLYNFVKSGLLETDGFALKSNLPTKTSQLTNDSGFITSTALEPYAKTANLPTKLSQFENDSKFIPDTALAPYAKTADLPTKLSQFTNDSKFVSSDVTDAIAKEVAENTVNIDLMIEKKDSLGHIKAISLNIEEWPTLTGLPLMIVKSGAPDKIPSFIGQKYLDTKNKKAYLAFGVSSVSDWVVMN